MYICFILALVMLAASPMRAADAELQKTVVRVDPRSGKLVRSTVVVRPPAPPVSIAELVEKTSKAHNVDPLLVDSLIQVESGYNPNAVSPKGAQGLMQLMPPTARMLGVNDSFDPAENIEAGVKYLKYLQELYKDDRLALAAYNAGPGAVDRFKQVPPYPETQKYVEKVGKSTGTPGARRSEGRGVHGSSGRIPRRPAVQNRGPWLSRSSIPSWSSLSTPMADCISERRNKRWAGAALAALALLTPEVSGAGRPRRMRPRRRRQSHRGAVLVAGRDDAHLHRGFLGFQIPVRPAARSRPAVFRY